VLSAISPVPKNLRDFPPYSSDEEEIIYDVSSGYSTSMAEDAPNLHASSLHYLNNSPPVPAKTVIAHSLAKTVTKCIENGLMC
jgi:hypothetical protein